MKVNPNIALLVGVGLILFPDPATTFAGLAITGATVGVKLFK